MIAKVINKFNDLKSGVTREVGDEFEVDKNRFDYLKKFNVVIEKKVEEVIEKEEVKEAIDEVAEEIANEIVEEIIEEPKKANKKRSK